MDFSAKTDGFCGGFLSCVSLKEKTDFGILCAWPKTEKGRNNLGVEIHDQNPRRAPGETCCLQKNKTHTTTHNHTQPHTNIETTRDRDTETRRLRDSEQRLTQTQRHTRARAHSLPYQPTPPKVSHPPTLTSTDNQAYTHTHLHRLAHPSTHAPPNARTHALCVCRHTQHRTACTMQRTMPCTHTHSHTHRQASTLAGRHTHAHTRRTLE